MSRRTVGVLLLLAASLALGILAGEQFFQLFLKNVPPMAMTGLTQSTAHAYFLIYGLVLGVVMTGLSVVAVALSGFFRSAAPKPRSPFKP